MWGNRKVKLKQGILRLMDLEKYFKFWSWKYWHFLCFTQITAPHDYHLWELYLNCSDSVQKIHKLCKIPTNSTSKTPFPVPMSSTELSRGTLCFSNHLIMRTMLSSPNLEKTRAQVIKPGKMYKRHSKFISALTLSSFCKAPLTVAEIITAIAHIPCLLCSDEN